ncbi:NUDIX domain-containing protein [Streptomyces aurantiacus]|uniref:NUDIX domain-containing protein n=1 Tax=Streptomyces aurantiacus TaxID=47760 RepID=UPI0006E22FF6|nr:NUDIX domain-containing protein [Streptomyces aurantiacus]
MKVRHNVRAVLLDEGRLVFLRRGWPGGSPYCTTVGGGVEPYDADLEAALRREVMEEIGATIGTATEFLTLTEPGEKVTVVQHYFRADVLDLDPNRRGGPELDDPDTGDFSPVWVALDASALAALELQPPELASYLCEQATTWGGA